MNWDMGTYLFHETSSPLGKHVDMFQQISFFFERLRIVLGFYGSVVGT